VPLAAFYFGPEATAARLAGRWGPNTIEDQCTQFSALGGWVLADLPGGRDALTELLAPELHDLVDSLTAESAAAVTYMQGSTSFGGSRLEIPTIGLRVRRADGTLAGTALLYKPAAGMTTLSSLAAAGDLEHLARMQGVARPARRPAAILFADLEGSSSLARRLSTAGYFALGRRLVRAADQCVVDGRGLVGRHVGDGVVAFFLAETAGSESAAVRACIAAARALRGAVSEVATRSGLEHADVVLRFGLHWGSTVYVGQITTSGRSEATGLGDEVNEAARIEACASGGRMLASKSLIERLAPDDAAALGIDPDRVTYVRLADLSRRPRRPDATLRRSPSATSDPPCRICNLPIDGFEATASTKTAARSRVDAIGGLLRAPSPLLQDGDLEQQVLSARASGSRRRTASATCATSSCSPARRFSKASSSDLPRGLRSPRRRSRSGCLAR
jgi:class 3 adenylate cyclase